MGNGAMEAEAVKQQQQGEDRALQYCNYIFEVVLNLGTTFGFQAAHRSSLSTCTVFRAASQHVPSSIYVVADHLSRALLDDVAARLCITDKLPLDLAFREAVWTVHAKFQAGYVRWTQELCLPMRPVCQQIIDPSTRYTDDTVIRLLLSETALLLLIHTEASSLQQLPSSCCLLYWLVRFSTQFKNAVEYTPLLSHAAVWAVPWNNRDLVLEVQTAASELLSSVGQPGLAEVEREWASRKDAAQHPGRVLAGLVSKAAAGTLHSSLTAQEALRVAYVFCTCEAAVMLEEVLQPLQLLLAYLEAHLSPDMWSNVCNMLESRLQHPAVLHKMLASLAVVDCHRVADTFQGLRDLGQHADGSFDAHLAAVWWEEMLLRNRPDTMAMEPRYQFGTTWHMLCVAFLVVQGTIAVTISLGASEEVSVCRHDDHTSCINITGLAWSSLLLSHAALRLIEALARYYHIRSMTQLPRLSSTLSETVRTTARNKISDLPIIIPMGLKGVKDMKDSITDKPHSWSVPIKQKARSTFGAYSGLLHSLWGAGIWFSVMLACFGLLFVPGTVGEVFEMAWWIISVTHSCLMVLSLVLDWYQWRQSPAAQPLPSSLIDKARGLFRSLWWLVAVFGVPAIILWVLSVPAIQALQRIIWTHLNYRRLAHPIELEGNGGGLVALAMGTLSTQMLGGVVVLLLLSMAIRVYLWASHEGWHIPLRSQTAGKWEELCGCFDELAETWCTKCLPQKPEKPVEEQGADSSPAGRFPVVWNGLVEDLVQRDLLANSEGETLAYTRIINVTTPSLLNSLGLPDMMPPAFVVGPALHQWLHQKANPTATVTLPIVQVLRLLLLLMHHADILNTGELFVMSLAVEDGMRVAKRQHVAIKHILVEGMKIISWSYKGGLQPSSDWNNMVKKHSKMTDAIFNFICAFELGVAPSTATAGDITPPQSPTAPPAPPKEATADHVAVARGLPQIANIGDSVTSLHGQDRHDGAPQVSSDVAGVDDASEAVMNSHTEAQEEAAKVTTLISKQLPGLKTSLSIPDSTAEQSGDEASCSTPTCSELEFGGGLYTPRSQSGDSDSLFNSTPRRSQSGDGEKSFKRSQSGDGEKSFKRSPRRRGEKSPRGKSSRKKGHDAPPPPPLIARLLRRTMAKSHYFMALSLYMVKLRRTPNWSKSEPEVPAAAEQLLSFMESVFHSGLGEEPVPPALAVPSLTSVLPLLPDQVVLPAHHSPVKRTKHDQQTSGSDSGAVEERPQNPFNVLFTPEGRPSRQLNQLIRRHLPEWQNFQERIAAITGSVPIEVKPHSFLKTGRLHRLQWEFLMWVGQRSSTLAHQVQVLASIHRATPTLLSAERPLSLAVGPKVYALWLEAVADLKYQVMVLAPHLCSHMDADDPTRKWNAQAVVGLLNRYSFIRAVSIHQESSPSSSHPSQPTSCSYSVLLKGRHNSASQHPNTATNQTDDTPDTSNDAKSSSKALPDTHTLASSDMVAVYLVKLPRDPYTRIPANSQPSHLAQWPDGPTNLATDNTTLQSIAPLARPYLFTEYIQTCSLPMANLGLAPALLIRNMLNELYCHDSFTNVFMGSITSVTVPTEPSQSVAFGEASSLRNWVASQSMSSYVPDASSYDVASVSSMSVQDFMSGAGPLSQRSPLPPAPIPASPSVVSQLRTPSIVSSSNFSLMMQVNGVNGANNNVSSQAGSPLSTPKFTSPWQQKSIPDGDASSVTRDSVHARDVEHLLQSRDMSTPRSQVSMLDFRRNNRLSYDMDGSAMTPELLASPASPAHTIDEHSSSSVCVVTPRPFKLFERTTSTGSNTENSTSFSLPPPGPSMDPYRSESGAVFARMDSSKLPALKTSVKPPPPSLTSSASFGRTSKDAPFQLQNHSSSTSLRMTTAASVSGMTEPETATASVITINSAVPHYESSMHFAPTDSGQPLLSSSASVVEQRFVMAASSSSSTWAGFVSGRFVGQGGMPTRRYLAALANLICLPAQAVGWQPAALYFVDKTWEMSPVRALASNGVTAFNSCGWVCRYIMVDMLGPQTTQELAALVTQLLHGRGVTWLCQEGGHTQLWLQKVLQMHARAALWCVRLIPMYIVMRSLIQLLSVPVGWTRPLLFSSPAFYFLPRFHAQSTARIVCDLAVSLGGLFLFVPAMQLLVMKTLHGWPAAGLACRDLFMSWMPACATLLWAAKSCPLPASLTQLNSAHSNSKSAHSNSGSSYTNSKSANSNSGSTHSNPGSCLQWDTVSSSKRSRSAECDPGNSSHSKGVSTSGVRPEGIVVGVGSGDGQYGEAGKDGTPTGKVAVQGGKSGSLHSETTVKSAQSHLPRATVASTSEHYLFIRLHCQWGRRLWIYSMWLVLLGALVLGSHSSHSHPLSVYTIASAGILPVVLGLLLLMAPLCLAHGCSWALADVVDSLRTWLQYMGESLGSGTQTTGWASVHALHAKQQWELGWGVWLLEVIGVTCSTVIVTWFSVQSLKDELQSGAKHARSFNDDWLGQALKSSSSEGIFALELGVRGLVAWCAQATLTLVLVGAASYSCSTRLHSLRWVLSLMLVVSPLALLTACFFGIMTSGTSLSASFFELFTVVVCNAAAAAWVSYVLLCMRWFLVQVWVQQSYWLGDLLVGLCVHLVWCCLACLAPVITYLVNKVQGMCHAIRRITECSSHQPPVDESS